MHSRYQVACRASLSLKPVDAQVHNAPAVLTLTSTFPSFSPSPTLPQFPQSVHRWYLLALLTRHLGHQACRLSPSIRLKTPEPHPQLHIALAVQCVHAYISVVVHTVGVHTPLSLPITIQTAFCPLTSLPSTRLLSLMSRLGPRVWL